MTAGGKVPANRKRCPRCGKVKMRATGFTHRADGSIFSWCKTCNTEYQRERAAKRRANAEGRPGEVLEP